MFHSGWQQPRPLSILNLCRILKEAELPSLPHQTDHSPALFSALPHGFLARPAPHTVLKQSPYFCRCPSSFRHPPTRPRGSSAADVQGPAEAQGWCWRAGSSVGHPRALSRWHSCTYCAGRVTRLLCPCQTSAAMTALT